MVSFHQLQDLSDLTTSQWDPHLGPGAKQRTGPDEEEWETFCFRS